LLLGPEDAGRQGIEDGDALSVVMAGQTVRVRAQINSDAPSGTALLRGAGPRGFVGPLEISKLEPVGSLSITEE
jgi:anaerobic selenocysteine-containing dehydrogenase